MNPIYVIVTADGAATIQTIRTPNGEKYWTDNLNAAKNRAARLAAAYGEDYFICTATTLVSPKTPNVTSTDISAE